MSNTTLNPTQTGFDAKLLSKQNVLAISGILLFLFVLTRSSLIVHFQDASWAIFFILGFYVRNVIGLPIFLLVAFIIDYLVIESKGGESYCFTVSYPFLAPAYGSLWLAGRWLATHYHENLKGLGYFVLAVLVGVTVCDLISSGAFYWLSGRFEATNMTEFSGRIAKYLPMYLKSAAFYIAIAAVVHFIVLKASKRNTQLSHS